MRFLALLLICSIACPAHACRIRDVPAEERLNSADEVYLGVVTGIALPELEHAVLEAKDSVLILGGNYAVRIAIFRTIRGERRAIVETRLPSCGPFVPELQSRVAVLVTDGSYVVSAEPALVRLVESQPGGL